MSRGRRGIAKAALVIATLAFARASCLPRVAWIPVAGATPAEPAIPELPLSIAIAREVTLAGVVPVQTDAWVEAQIAEAGRLFAPQRLRFTTVASRAIAPAYAHLESRRDRDALAAVLRPGRVNVFVVASLRDVDEPGRMRMGVCWSPRGDAVTRYVVVSAIARPSVLAHELGHYFGNPHSSVANNVMSYERTPGADVFFDDAQGAILRASARRLFAGGVLKAAWGSGSASGARGERPSSGQRGTCDCRDAGDDG